MHNALSSGLNLGGRIQFLMSVLTVALLSISSKFKTWMAHTAEGAQRVDTTVGTSGGSKAALINICGETVDITTSDACLHVYEK